MGTEKKLTPPKLETKVMDVPEIEVSEKITLTESEDTAVDTTATTDTTDTTDSGITNTKQGILLKNSANYNPTRRDDKLRDFEESQKRVQEKIAAMNNSIAIEEKNKLAKVNETLAKRGFDKVDTFNSIEKSKSVKIIQMTSKETKNKTVIRSKVEMKSLNDSEE